MRQVGMTPEIDEILRDIFSDEARAGEEPCQFAPADDPHPCYITDIHKCDGLGYLHALDDNAVFRERCKCWLKWKKGEHLKDYLKQLGIDERIVRNANRETHALGTVNRLYYKADDEYPKKRALLITGNCNTGKTVAAHCTMMKLIERFNCRGIFIDTQRVADNTMAKASRDPDIESKAYREWTHRRNLCGNLQTMVVIDDIGRERDSKAVRDEIAGLITTLYNRRARTIMTTNYRLSDLRDMLGEHIASRLSLERGWCMTIKV